MTTAIPGHATAFEQDVTAYLDALPKLLSADEGKFVLVGHGMLADLYDSQAEAMGAGYARFGLDGFLVQKVCRHDFEMGAHWHRACQS